MAMEDNVKYIRCDLHMDSTRVKGQVKLGAVYNNPMGDIINVIWLA